MPTRDLAQARRMLETRGAFTLRELCNWVAGEQVRGSWWSHPAGKAIFAIADALDHADDVLVCKLEAGKVTFVHARLWPALFRVVTDPDFQKRIDDSLSPEARNLLAKVEQAPVRTDLLALDKKLRTRVQHELEGAWRVHARGEHTEAGHHATVLQAWSVWAPREVVTAARNLGFDDAVRVLEGAGLHLPQARRRATSAPSRSKPSKPRAR